jgi:2-polyprenyl-3-methyl-5-hydroxy-6-metoxy-1,4-benzoquinol methylase
MQMEIAVHNQGWTPALYDFRYYLAASSVRYYKAYRSFAKKGNNQTICDVGGFWGTFPITLKALGYDVTMTESLQYYSDSFDDLQNYISDTGVDVVDYNPFEPEASTPGRFNVVTIMAILEHYPHSLKRFMENITSMLNPGGRIYIEVPNIAYWPKRANFLLGRSPLVPIREIFKSEVPFIGHHHEFSISELRDLALLSGLSILLENFYNYSLGDSFKLSMLVRNPIQFLAFRLLKSSRECLAIFCKLQDKPK